MQISVNYVLALAIWGRCLGKGFPHSSVGKESACNAGDPGLIPGSGRFPWRREWLLTSVFLPGESHGQSMGPQRVAKSLT